MNAVEDFIKLVEKYIDRYNNTNNVSLHIDGLFYNSYSPLVGEIFRLLEQIKFTLDEDEYKLFENKLEEIVPLVCPKEGEFIAYKKCMPISDRSGGLTRIFDVQYRIVMLLIPADAKRISFLSNKCRCNKAKVIDIYNPDTKRRCKSARSKYDKDFIYEIGKTIEVENFDENRIVECSNGIHFFMTEEEEAIKYR